MRRNIGIGLLGSILVCWFVALSEAIIIDDGVQLPHPPAAVNDGYHTNLDATLTVGAPGVLGNDTDPDSLVLTAVLVSNPAHGTVTLNGNGSFVYTPATNFSGTDSFTYQVNDGTFNSNIATVTMSVTPPLVAAFGIFRQGTWALDYNGSQSWNPGIDKIYTFGLATDIPVSGDWDGDGLTEVGVFRVGSGRWYVDYDDNGTWTAGDKIYIFGLQTDKPATGDWNGDGKTKIGVFRSDKWHLDYNGNSAWEGCGVDKCYTFGLATDVPVTGDWNGNGRTEIGVFRNGTWILDYNGDGTWNGCGTTPTTDRCFTFGLATDIPVTGDWNGDGKTEIGVFRNGMWILDYNGDGAWNGAVTDELFSFGLPTDKPVTGIW